MHSIRHLSVLTLAMLGFWACGGLEVGQSQSALAGDPCDQPGGETCNNLQDDDGDALVDCLDPDCLSDTGFVCGATGISTPACQPLLDDPARLVFKTRPKLDLFKVNGRLLLEGREGPDRV